MFINTMRAPYYDSLVGNATKNFLDVVVSRETINDAIIDGKIFIEKSFESSKNLMAKGKEEKVNVVSENHHKFTWNPH